MINEKTILTETKTDMSLIMKSKKRASIFGICSGIIITPLVAFIAIVLAGAGHGSYSFAKLMFPFTMILTLLFNDTITYPLIGLALLQFPFYGYLLGAT